MQQSSSAPNLPSSSETPPSPTRPFSPSSLAYRSLAPHTLARRPPSPLKPKPVPALASPVPPPRPVSLIGSYRPKASPRLERSGSTSTTAWGKMASTEFDGKGLLFGREVPKLVPKSVAGTRIQKNEPASVDRATVQAAETPTSEVALSCTPSEVPKCFIEKTPQFALHRRAPSTDRSSAPSTESSSTPSRTSRNTIISAEKLEIDRLRAELADKDALIDEQQRALAEAATGQALADELVLLKHDDEIESLKSDVIRAKQGEEYLKEVRSVLVFARCVALTKAFPEQKYRQLAGQQHQRTRTSSLSSISYSPTEKDVTTPRATTPTQPTTPRPATALGLNRKTSFTSLPTTPSSTRLARHASFSPTKPPPLPFSPTMSSADRRIRRTTIDREMIKLRQARGVERSRSLLGSPASPFGNENAPPRARAMSVYESRIASPTKDSEGRRWE